MLLIWIMAQFHKLTQSDGALKMRKLKWEYFILREKNKYFK